MATSGPGATNLVTGIADAFMDSMPLVAITGQVPQHMIGKGAFQETDVFGMTLPVVKHNYLVIDINDIPRVVKEAFHIAQTGRPGPVLIDIPKNIQIATTQPIFPAEVHLRGYDPMKYADDVALNEVIGLIESHKKPMIYCGGGIISGNASAELLEFVERTQIPVATTLMGIGCFPETHPLSLKWLGMHGTVYANNAVNEADLLLAIGVRFDDRVTGKIEKFAEHGTIVHIDIDNSEINKNKVVRLPILSDVKYALGRLNELLEKAGHKRVKSNFTQFPPWYKKIEAWRKKFPFTCRDTEDAIQPQYAIQLLWEMTKGEAIITTGVGQHQMWAGQHYRFHPAAHVHHIGGTRLDGLRLSRRDRREGGLSRQAGHRHRRRRLVRDEHPGARHRAHREHRGEGDDPEQPAPRHGGAMGGPLLRQQSRPHLPRRPARPQAHLSRLREDVRRLRRAVRARHPQERPQGRDPAHARLEGGVRARRDGALHRARAADDSGRRDLQGRHHRRQNTGSSLSLQRCNACFSYHAPASMFVFASSRLSGSNGSILRAFAQSPPAATDNCISPRSP